MTANKMPEMPEAVATVQFRHGRIVAGHVYMDLPMVPIYTKAQVEADRRACYLAGIAAARECVPDAKPFTTDDAGAIEATCFNRCRTETLAKLSALEQEAKK